MLFQTTETRVKLSHTLQVDGGSFKHPGPPKRARDGRAAKKVAVSRTMHPSDDDTHELPKERMAIISSGNSGIGTCGGITTSRFGIWGPPNDCRISCNAASHATKAAARRVLRLENGSAGGAPPWSADCDSRPLGRRANKRRVVSFLQGLGGDHYAFPISRVATGDHASRRECVRGEARATRTAHDPFAGRLMLRTAHNFGSRAAVC